MLLEGAIGDAYGAGFEFAERAVIEKFNTVSQYISHPEFPEINGKYTDDTQMALALAEMIVEEVEWTTLNVAEYFVRVFKRDPRNGYAKRFKKLLETVRDGADLLETIVPKSIRNGAAMRAHPLGVLKNEKEILTKSEIQASITHNTVEGICSAQTIALASHFFIYKKGDKKQLIEYLNDWQDWKWKGFWQGEIKVDAIQTVEAVLCTLLNISDLKEMLKSSVAFGGDVDTVAALTMAIGCQMESVENNLPEFLFQNIENGTFGRDYIVALNERLMDVK